MFGFAYFGSTPFAAVIATSDIVSLVRAIAVDDDERAIGTGDSGSVALATTNNGTISLLPST